MASWGFVADMVTSSPTVNLNLNSAPYYVGAYNLDPADYDQGWASSPLRHGDRPTRSRAPNRVLQIEVHITSATPDLQATAIENLGKQIAVNNILRVQFGAAASSAVFFRTFADPKYAATIRNRLTSASSINLSIIAEPFAYGPRVEVTGSPFTVSNNPAAATNPCRFDLASILGDVETPLLLVATSTGASGTPSGLVSKRVHISTRRRGTPGNYSNVIQGEDCAQGTGAVVTVDAAMSNGSKSRIGFGTPGMTLRLSDTFPGNGTSNVEARGEYRVYGRMAKSIAGDTISVQLGYGAAAGSAILNDAVTLPAGAAGPYWVDLGKVPVPQWADPVTIGFSGVPTKVLLAFLGLYAARTAGSGSLDVDCLYFMPADELTVIADFPADAAVYAVDATTDAGGSIYSTPTTLDEILTTATPPAIVGGGGFPELIPGITNRIHLLRQVDPAGAVDAIGDTTTVRAYYWPRWREFTRP